jgi:hypothetical protein
MVTTLITLIIKDIDKEYNKNNGIPLGEDAILATGYRKRAKSQLTRVAFLGLM